MQSIFPQWVLDLNTVLSFLGFAITLWVLFEVRGIKNSFRRKARLPEILVELSGVSSYLNKALQSLPSESLSFCESIRKAVILLERASDMLPYAEKTKIANIASKIQKSLKFLASSNNLDSKLPWDLYLDIQDGIHVLDQILKDTQWE